MTKMSPFQGLEGTGRFLSRRSNGKAKAHARSNIWENGQKETCPVWCGTVGWVPFHKV